MTQSRSGAGMARQQQRFVFWMLAPTTLLLLGMTLFPFLSSLYWSVTSYTLLDPGSTHFTGLSNYLKFFSDPDLRQAVWVTVLFTVGAVGIETLLGVGIATALHGEQGRLTNPLRTLYLLPMVVTPVAATFMFRLMLNRDSGVINYLLGRFGVPPQDWLGDPHLALWTLILVDVWQWTPFILIIVSGALAVLPSEPFEAARVDGASGWQVFRSLTLPMLAPYLVIALVLRTIDAFKTFDIIQILTGGGPGNVTRTLNLYAYKQGIEFLNMGQAAAISMTMLIAITLFSRAVLRRAGLLGRNRG